MIQLLLKAVGKEYNQPHNLRIFAAYQTPCQISCQSASKQQQDDEQKKCKRKEKQRIANHDMRQLRNVMGSIQTQQTHIMQGEFEC